MKTLGVLAAALVLAGTAAGAITDAGWWKTTDMKAAIRALGYPKPHPRKLACHGLGAPDTLGRFAAFRCVATYTRHRHSRFYTAGRGLGGWLCAAKTLAGCKLLRRGFVTSGDVSVEGINAAADLAAKGWMVNHYGGYQTTRLCQQTGTLSWSCAFTDATVTISMKQAKGGYVISAAT